MNEQTSSPLSPKDIPASDGHYDHRVTLSPRPVQIGRVNWIGLWTLYMREVQRFAKV